LLLGVAWRDAEKALQLCHSEEPVSRWLPRWAKEQSRPRQIEVSRARFLVVPIRSGLLGITRGSRCFLVRNGPLTRPAPAGESAGSGTPSPPRGRGAQTLMSPRPDRGFQSEIPRRPDQIGAPRNDTRVAVSLSAQRTPHPSPSADGLVKAPAAGHPLPQGGEGHKR
jgi:hypothetical protein